MLHFINTCSGNSQLLLKMYLIKILNPEEIVNKVCYCQGSRFKVFYLPFAHIDNSPDTFLSLNSCHNAARNHSMLNVVFPLKLKQIKITISHDLCLINIALFYLI